MTKGQLIDAVAGVSKLTKKDTEATVNALLEVVTKALKKGDKISLIGFGSFEVRERAAREGVNPSTKQKIKIPACKVPVFKAGKSLKDAVK